MQVRKYSVYVSRKDRERPRRLRRFEISAKDESDFQAPLAACITLYVTSHSGARQQDKHVQP